MDPNSQIDVKFFFGTSNKTEVQHQLQSEKAAYPNDTIITTRPEGRDEGKILDFFQYARSILYTAHPIIPEKYCQRYLYVAKSDDDSVIHLPRLSNLLLGLPRNGTHFVGNVFHDVITQARIQISGMHGMLYLMTADLVEWINFSPIPRDNVKGVEDQQVGYWFQLSKIHIDWFYVGVNRFHDLMDVNPITKWFQHRITSETIVVHYCKTLQDFFRCMSGLLEDISTQHSLFTPAAAQHRLKENGILLPLNNISVTLQSIAEKHYPNPETALPLAEFDHHLLLHSITTHTGVNLSDLEMGVVMRDFVEMGRNGVWISGEEELRKFLWSYVVRVRAKDIGVVCEKQCIQDIAVGLAKQGGNVVVGKEDLIRRLVVNSLRHRHVGGHLDEEYVELFMNHVEKVGLKYKQVDLAACLREFERLEQIDLGLGEETEREEMFTRFVVESAVLKMADRVGVANMTLEMAQHATDVMTQFVPFVEFEQEVVEFFVVQTSFNVGIDLNMDQMVERSNVVSDILETRNLLPEEMELISVWLKIHERGKFMGQEWSQKDIEKLARDLKGMSKFKKLTDKVVDTYCIWQIVETREGVLGIKLNRKEKDRLVETIRKKIEKEKGVTRIWDSLDSMIELLK
ncbi:UNVERIFIED_CONTAM: hypothetical protein HDU68_008992 [Siphonaria sp. JEL0065]|nr:hypothetical protein HDU68_008992 [Siphonaria sp. JEL0065]